MGIRFSKSIKLGDFLKINLSKSGISASIGKKGATLNLGKNGTYVNLSPTVAGIKGTGVSYRKKITGGYKDILNKLSGNVKTEKESIDSEAVQTKEVDTSIVDKFYQDLEANINIHKYADNVLTKQELVERIDNFESDSSKQIYELAIGGDEETIESLVGAFMNNLDLSYEVKANYELEDTVLYVDLDLPEIEDLKVEYPVVVKNEVVYKKKTASDLKDEYARTVISLGIYLAANFFNITSYIEEIVMSAFTTRRDSDGNLKDEYLYSVKYKRETFENTDLAKVDDPYNFLLQFENRINLSTNKSFKAITPYEMASVAKTNSIIDDAVAGLKELGYKASDINNIIPELSKMSFENSGDCIKEALKLLSK